MNKEKIEDLSRRSFLTTGSAALASAVLAPIISSLRVEAAPNALPQATDAYEIGYMEMPTEGPAPGSTGQARRDAFDELQDRLKREVTRNQLQRIRINEEENDPGLIKRATAIQPDPEFVNKDVSVILLGLYTNRRQWRNNDGGLFRMNLSFDPIAGENKCLKPVSTATISSSFTAKPNSFVNEYTTFPSLPPIPIKQSKKLGISFDLIDIADEADRHSIVKAIDFSKQAAKAAEEIPGVAAVPAYGVSLSIINTASNIINLFVDKPENKVLWGTKNNEGVDRTVYLAATGPDPRKLRPGIYFIAGRGANNTPPQWEKLHLRIPNSNQTGIEGALYQRSEDRRRLEPVDFTYVKLQVAYAT
jgi:hypothetical protein